MFDEILSKLFKAKILEHETNASFNVPKLVVKL
jgi:hypothetical protein